MKTSMSVFKWLDVAVSGIRFTPDREKVRKELREHIEDKALDLGRIFPDMSEEEAWDRALAGMGDAEEVKAELARVHRPWLGYLLRVSQFVVLCTLALLIAGSITGQWREKRWYQGDRQWYEEVYDQGLYGSEFQHWEGERLALYAPDAQARLGRATVTVPRAARRVGPDGQLFLYIDIRVVWDYPWETAKNNDPLWHFRMDGEPGHIGNGTVGWNWQRMTLWRYEDQETEQVTLTYPPVPDFSLTVDLTREVEP